MSLLSPSHVNTYLKGFRLDQIKRFNYIELNIGFL